MIVGNASWRFGSYLAYCRNGAQDDEMPLYMFDKVGGAGEGLKGCVCGGGVDAGCLSHQEPIFAQSQYSYMSWQGVQT